MKIIFVSLHFCLLVFISCKDTRSKKNSKKIETTNLHSDTITIKRDIPKWFSEYPSIQEKTVEEDKMLNLESLIDGFNGLQIRIWIGCGALDTQQVIIISKFGKNWAANFYDYTYTYDNVGKILSIKYKKEEKIPKSGWESFTKMLMATGIESLRDYEKFYPDYYYPMDANSVAVEIATSTTYKLYQYPAFGFNKKNNEDVARLNTAISLIEKECNYKRACE
jgi:hypothetical protein